MGNVWERLELSQQGPLCATQCLALVCAIRRLALVHRVRRTAFVAPHTWVGPCCTAAATAMTCSSSAAATRRRLPKSGASAARAAALVAEAAAKSSGQLRKRPMQPHSSAKLRAAEAADHWSEGGAFDPGWSSTAAWRGVAGGVSGAGGGWALSAWPCAGAGMSGSGQGSRARKLGGLLAREPGLPRGCRTGALLRLGLRCMLHRARLRVVTNCRGALEATSQRRPLAVRQCWSWEGRALPIALPVFSSPHHLVQPSATLCGAVYRGTPRRASGAAGTERNGAGRRP